LVISNKEELPMIKMEEFMDINSLHREGHSIRYIAKKTGHHRDTVKKYLDNKSFPKYQKRKRKKSQLESYYQIIKDYLDQDNYKATWIYDRIKAIGYSGGYDVVKNYVKSIKEKKKRIAYVRFETMPGLQAQVDWGDFQVKEANGQITTYYAFAIVLGFSRALYVEFVDRCTLEKFMDCHKNAFKYLKGIPAEILYDNMKNVVIRRKGGEALFNTEFLHFTYHYGFKPKLCPPYSPWVKGKVERPMNYIRERFWRGYRFESLNKSNKDIINWLNDTANKRIHGTHKQPINERWKQEIPSLREHPPAEYDTSLKVFRKVYKDCQISYNGNRYVVPYHVVGRKVMIKIKNNIIRIYHDQEFLVSYRESEEKNTLISNPSFYEKLKRDKEQLSKKYFGNKGKATRGLTTRSLFPQVFYRPLEEYDSLVQGGVSWNN
jgi:transposase